MLSLALILFVYLYPIFIALIRYWTKLICYCIILSDDKNSFNRLGRLHKKRQQQQTVLYIKVFTLNTNPSESPFSWDTDGIPFIIDNSTTAIISNERKLFTGPLVPTKVTLETSKGVSTKTKLVGPIRLVLTYDSNQNHAYIVPGCVYNPDTPLNILGVPALGSFFGDSADAIEVIAADGTNIKSGATKSNLVWDDGKHERHFLHGSSQMPELFLYASNGSFNAFCTRVHKMLSDKVHYAFSSAYSIHPTTTAQEPSNPHLISDEDGELEEDGPYSWYQPEANSTNTSLNTDPKSKPKASWSPLTKPPAPIAAKHTESNDFQQGMELTWPRQNPGSSLRESQR